MHKHVKSKQPYRSGRALTQNGVTATANCSLDLSHTHAPVFLILIWYTDKQTLMAFWVSTESETSWESLVTFLASALLPALDL